MIYKKMCMFEPRKNTLLYSAYCSFYGNKAQQSSAYKRVMGKLKKRHNGMTQTREPPTFDSS